MLFIFRGNEKEWESLELRLMPLYLQMLLQSAIKAVVTIIKLELAHEIQVVFLILMKGPQLHYIHSAMAHLLVLSKKRDQRVE